MPGRKQRILSTVAVALVMMMIIMDEDYLLFCTVAGPFFQVPMATICCRANHQEVLRLVFQVSHNQKPLYFGGV
jgi:hypothetical protein